MVFGGIETIIRNLVLSLAYYVAIMLISDFGLSISDCFALSIESHQIRNYEYFFKLLCTIRQY